VSEQDIDDMFNYADKNADGKISYLVSKQKTVKKLKIVKSFRVAALNYREPL
jgi:hypothetical protein